MLTAEDKKWLMKFGAALLYAIGNIVAGPTTCQNASDSARWFWQANPETFAFGNTGRHDNLLPDYVRRAKRKDA